MKIYVAAVEGLRKRKDRLKLILPPKLVEKTKFGSQLFRFVKTFVPNYGFDALLC